MASTNALAGSPTVFLTSPVELALSSVAYSRNSTACDSTAMRLARPVTTRIDLFLRAADVVARCVTAAWSGREELISSKVTVVETRASGSETLLQATWSAVWEVRRVSVVACP